LHAAAFLSLAKLKKFSLGMDSFNL
jgi:hypothetical protein